MDKSKYSILFSLSVYKFKSQMLHKLLLTEQDLGCKHHSDSLLHE